MLQFPKYDWKKSISKLTGLFRPLTRLFWPEPAKPEPPAPQVEPTIEPAPAPEPKVLATPEPPVVALPAEKDFNGTGHEILLQGFHWASCNGSHHHGRKKNWYVLLSEHASPIKDAGFDGVWFPPSSDSLSPQGYMPRQWHVFDTEYGTAAELKQAIDDLKPLKCFADLVLNHRVGMWTSGADFANPAFENNEQAVVCNDESGCGRGRPDSGCTFSGARDLDHSNADVQKKVREYLMMLKDRFGFAGWRYDMVTGYGANYVAQYNRESRPYMAIAECWSNYDDIDRWVEHSKAFAHVGRSMAFDFPTRANLYTAIVEDRFEILKSIDGKPSGLIGKRPDLAVTFADNHDTEWRRHGENGTRHFENHWVSAAYAYLLTHPGTPCVFWCHYFELGHDIQQKIRSLMHLRRAHNIHSRSVVHIIEARQTLYAALMGDTAHGHFHPRVAVKLGSADWNPGHGWSLANFGNHYAVWVR